MRGAFEYGGAGPGTKPQQSKWIKACQGETEMILSLQGCMAVGKTTAARYLQQHASGVQVYFENNSDVIAAVARLGLDKRRYPEYLQIQRLWIQHEIRRWHSAAEHRCSVMDFGAEEIEFYTLHYPQSIGQSWPVEQDLAPELAQLRRCMPQRILFLDAGEEELRRRKESDAERSRGFFEHYVQHLLPLKRAWFLGRGNVDVLRVDGLTPDQVGQAVQQWVERCMQQAAL